MLLDKIKELTKDGYSIYITDVECDGADIITVEVGDRKTGLGFTHRRMCALDEKIVCEAIDKLVAKHEERRTRDAK